jgi:hypothetical protein
MDLITQLLITTLIHQSYVGCKSNSQYIENKEGNYTRIVAVCKDKKGKTTIIPTIKEGDYGQDEWI